MGRSIMDIIDIFSYYLIDKAAILIPCLWVLGKIIKNTPKIPNYIIPYVLLAFAIAGSMGILGANISSVFQGIILTGLSVFGYESAKSFLETINAVKN